MICTILIVLIVSIIYLIPLMFFPLIAKNKGAYEL